MKFNALSVVKVVASGVVGLGTAKIVGSIIKDHVKPETLIDKITVTAAASVISGIVTNATKDYTKQTIDDVVETAATLIDQLKTSQKVAKINRGESTFEKEGLDQSRFRKNEKGHWVQISQEEWEDIHGVDPTTTTKYKKDPKIPGKYEKPATN